MRRIGSAARRLAEGLGPDVVVEAVVDRGVVETRQVVRASIVM